MTMLVLYLPCLIVGGVLVALSVAGAGDADFDFDTDLIGDIDVLPDASGFHSVAQFLSLRGVVFFVAFFGLSGTLLSLVGSPVWIGLTGSFATGIVAAIVAERAFRYLKRTESGQALDLHDLEGRPATVLVGCGRDQLGKISLAVGDRTVQVLARAADESIRASFAAGESVMIIAIENGVAMICEKEFVES